MAGRGLDLQRRLGSVIETVQDVVGVGPAIVNAAASAVKDHVAPLPFAAPKSIFNVPITGARRVAAQLWPIERLPQGQLRCRRDAQRCGVGNVRGCATGDT